MFRCLYTILLIGGGGYIFVSFLVGELVEWGEQMLDGIGDWLESTLEGLFDSLGMHIDLDFVDHDIHVDKGPGPLSFRTLLYFGTGFGAGGMAGYLLGWTDVFTLVPAFGTGLTFGFFAYLLIRFMWKGQGTTNIDRADYVGLPGNVITTIPDGGLGQIAFTYKLHRKILPAKSHDGKSIPSGTKIFITEVSEGGVCVIKSD